MDILTCLIWLKRKSCPFQIVQNPSFKVLGALKCTIFKYFGVHDLVGKFKDGRNHYGEFDFWKTLTFTKYKKALLYSKQFSSFFSSDASWVMISKWTLRIASNDHQSNCHITKRRTIHMKCRGPFQNSKVSFRPILGSGFYKDPVWAVDSPKAHFGQWILRTEF